MFHLLRSLYAPNRWFKYHAPIKRASDETELLQRFATGSPIGETQSPAFPPQTSNSYIIWNWKCETYTGLTYICSYIQQINTYTIYTYNCIYQIILSKIQSFHRIFLGWITIKIYKNFLEVFVKFCWCKPLKQESGQL